ncbi:HET-domain-containing protein, partial [Saccharata proteae CBS 121410]
YCALSYCWGSSNTCTTTTKNLSARTTAIPLDEFSKTIKEAILLLRNIGIHYLWVDALCILQDSPADWAVEAAKMSQIYSGAMLTIAAENAQDSSEGLFQVSDQIPQVIPNPPPNQSQSKSPYWNSDESRPLSSRGWCLQENLLSARKIHVMLHDSIWSCYQKGISNSRKVLRRGTRTGLFTTQAELRFRNALRLNTDQDYVFRGSIFEIFRNWAGWVGDYTRRSFTYESDRLMALDGICTSLEKAFGGTFVAGMWTGQFLAHSLLWHPDQRAKESWPSPQPEVPSWSWVS